MAASNLIPLLAMPPAFPKNGLVAAYEPFRQRNLLRQSGNLADTGFWTRTGLSAVELVPGGGPGGRDAWRITEDTGNSRHQLVHSALPFATGDTVLLSVCAKASTRMRVQIDLADAIVGADAYTTFDLTTGTASPGLTATPYIISLGDGWYRVAYLARATANGSGFAAIFNIVVDANTTIYTGESKSLLIAEPQLERVPAGITTPSPYQPTDALQLLEQSARWKGERRRNLLWKTEDLTDAVWSKAAGVTIATAIAAPDGTTSAFRIEAFNGATGDRIYQVLKSGEPLPLRAFSSQSFVKGTAGKTARVVLKRASGTSVVASVDVSLTGEWQSVTVPTLTTLADSVGLSFAYACMVTDTAPTILDVWHPQVELGSAATPYQNPANLYPAQRGSTTAAAGDVNDPAIDSNRWVFDGTNDYVDLLTEDFGGACSLFAGPGEAWTVAVVASAADGVSGNIVARAGSAASETRMFQLFKGADNTANITLRGANNQPRLFDALPHFHCITWDGTVSRYYFDGAAPIVLNAVGVATEEVGQRVILGARTNGTSVFLNGSIPAAYFWSRALSPSEVARLRLRYLKPELARPDVGIFIP
jgi:hypothetical protein